MPDNYNKSSRTGANMTPAFETRRSSVEKKQVGTPDRKLAQKFQSLTESAIRERQMLEPLPSIVSSSIHVTDSATDSDTDGTCGSCGSNENTTLKPRPGVNPKLKGDVSFL